MGSKHREGIGAPTPAPFILAVITQSSREAFRPAGGKAMFSGGLESLPHESVRKFLGCKCMVITCSVLKND